MSISDKPFAYTPEAECRKNRERVVQRIIAKNALISGKITKEQYERLKMSWKTAQ